MLVRAYLEIDIDIDELDRQCVIDVEEYAKELCEREMKSILENHDYEAEDFTYEIVTETDQ